MYLSTIHRLAKFSSPKHNKMSKAPIHSNMKTKPVILLVCGGWHVPEHYKPLIVELESLGFTVDCPRLPTNSGNIPPTAGLKDDAKLVRDTAIEHLKNGHNVFPLMHSYGGSVGTIAFSGLGLSEQSESKPANAGIPLIIYLSALVPSENGPLVDPMPDSPPPYFDFSTVEKDGMLRLNTEMVAEYMYGDLTSEQAKHAVSLLVPQPASVQPETFAGTSPVVPAYKTIPTIYVICEQDRAFPPMYQEMMVHRLQEAAENGRRAHTVRINASHSPFVSMPKQFARVVEERIEAASKEIRN